MVTHLREVMDWVLCDFEPGSLKSRPKKLTTDHNP